MEMNKKSEHINDIVRSEYQPTLRERVLGSKVSKGIFYLGVATYIFLASGLTAVAGKDTPPPTPPFPGGTTVEEPKGKHEGWGNGNEYRKGWENSQGNHYHKGWIEY